MAGPNPPNGISSEQMQRLMRRVLEAERDKLHMGNPMGINDDLQSIIEDEVD